MNKEKALLISVKQIFLIGIMCLGLITTIGTGSGDDDKNGSSTGTEATLKHEGFDFSAGVVPENGEDSDGDTINWVPDPSMYLDGASYGDGVWWRSKENTASENFSKDLGEVDLDSLTDIPTIWDGGTGIALISLQENHVYIVKCKDGYAAFLVKSIDLDTWDVAVDYIYTSGTSF
ncbi:MAG: hypothetical protein KJ737_25435 [Proteobacteria bacterium]|nr:hypothetical protein [Pseudomonadota bacterium]